MKYSQRKKDVLLALANALRPLTIKETKAGVWTMLALQKEECVIEDNLKYSITEKGREIVKVLKQIEEKLAEQKVTVKPKNYLKPKDLYKND